jgi:tight adherence protein B
MTGSVSWGPCLALAAAVLVGPGPHGRRRLTVVRPAAARPVRLPSAAIGVLVLGAVAGGVLAGPAGIVTGGLVAHVGRRRRARSRARTRTTAEAGQLAEALSRMVDELRRGAHPAAALEGVRADGPLAERLLGQAAAGARLGDDVPAALERGAPRSGPLRAEMRRVAAAWSIAERHGAPLADLLEGALTDLRWRRAFEERSHARMAGPRATAAVLTALPLLGIGLGHLLGADPLGVLRAGVLGQLLLLGGSGLLWCGLTWSDRIAAGPVPS